MVLHNNERDDDPDGPELVAFAPGYVSGETGVLLTAPTGVPEMQKLDTIAPSSTTWRKRAKLAIAGVALAAFSMFGAATMDAPDVPQADEEAGATWSFTSGGGGKGGPSHGTYGATWS
mgnify:CR=1 FL=1